MLSNKICQFLMFNLILLMCSDEDPLTSKAMGQQRQMTSSKSAGPAAIGHLIQFDGDNFDKFFEDSLPEYAKVNKPPKGNRGKPNQDLHRRSTEPVSNAYTILDPEPLRPFQPLGHTGEPSIEYTQIAQTAQHEPTAKPNQNLRRRSAEPVKRNSSIYTNIDPGTSGAFQPPSHTTKPSPIEYALLDEIAAYKSFQKQGTPNQCMDGRSNETVTPNSTIYTTIDPVPSRPFQPLGPKEESSIEYTQIAQTGKQGSFSSSAQNARNSLYPTIPKVEPTHIPQEYRR